MSPPVDLAAIRALVEEANTGPVSQRVAASMKIVTALPALLARLERAERAAQRLREQIESADMNKIASAQRANRLATPTPEHP